MQATITVFGQAHLGCTYSELKEFEPDATFQTGSTDDGIAYVCFASVRGVFAYYFNEDIVVHCRLIPYNVGCVNMQCEIYNKKYTIFTSSQWTAYLGNGGKNKIVLSSNDDGLWVFDYYPL